jgi:hypothetical protein
MQTFWYYASKTGLVSDGSQPELDCAWPLKEVKSLADQEPFSANHFEQAKKLVEDKEWQVVSSWKDPDAANGGDLHLWTKPQVGRYHFMKTTMSVKNTTPAAIMGMVMSENFADRKKFSADIASLEIIAMTENTVLEHVTYSAPAPVAGRDFCLLRGKPRDIGGGTMIAFGCSVASEKCPEVGGFVRGVCFFCWHMVPVGEHVLVTYVNCLDPRGWTPPFLMAWLKGAATQEFINIRNVMAGKAADLHLIELNELGIPEEELKKEIAEKDKQ